MKNLNSHTGYLIIDHRDSPGLRPDDIPLRLRSSAVAVGEGEVFEADTKICTHCQRGVILNPGRVRDRGVCPYCHHYICDTCHRMLKATGQCIPFKKILDDTANMLEKGIILTDM